MTQMTSYYNILLCTITNGLLAPCSASLLLAQATDRLRLGVRRLETTADEKGDTIVVVIGS